MNADSKCRRRNLAERGQLRVDVSECRVILSVLHLRTNVVEQAQVASLIEQRGPHLAHACVGKALLVHYLHYRRARDSAESAEGADFRCSRRAAAARAG